MVVLAGTVTSTPSIFNVGMALSNGNPAIGQLGGSEMPSCPVA
jgi:hypothetical protein